MINIIRRRKEIKMIKKILALAVATTMMFVLVSCGGPSVKDIAGKYELVNMEGSGTEDLLEDGLFDDVESMLAFAKLMGMKFEINFMADKTASMIFADEVMTYKWKPCVLIDEDGKSLPFTYDAGTIKFELNDVSMTFVRSDN